MSPPEAKDSVKYLFLETETHFGKPKEVMPLYLDRILGSTTKVNTLSVLIPSPKRRYMEIELARESGSAATSTKTLAKAQGKYVKSGTSLQRI